MKKRQILSVLLVCLLIVTLFAGCSKGVYMDAVSNGEAMAPELSGNNKADQTGTDVLQDRKLIRKIHMSAETEDMDALLAHIDQRVGQLEGYIEARDIYNGSAYYGSRNRSATLTIRIPADKLDGFVQQIGEVSNIISNKETSDDVTLQYVDTESHVKALETEQDRLLSLLEKAETLKDILTLEERLTKVRYELERYASYLRTLDNQVTYATIHLSITEVKEYTPVIEEEPTVWQRISQGFTRSLKDIGESFTDFFVWFTVNSPYLLIWGIIAAVVIIILRKRGHLRPRRKKTAPPKEPTE